MLLTLIRYTKCGNKWPVWPVTPYRIWYLGKMLWYFLQDELCCFIHFTFFIDLALGLMRSCWRWAFFEMKSRLNIFHTWFVFWKKLELSKNCSILKNSCHLIKWNHLVFRIGLFTLKQCHDHFVRFSFWFLILTTNDTTLPSSEPNRTNSSPRTVNSFYDV